MRHIEASKARRSFSQLYHQVAYGGERVIVENHGKGLVALVPIADLERLLGTTSTAGEPSAPNRESCLEALRRERAALEASGVLHVALFGSVARAQANSDSDVDVLVDLNPDAHVDLFDFAGLRERLVSILGREVDLVSRRALTPERDATILNEAVYAF